MILKVIPVGPLGCNCVILGDEASHAAVVIDPGDEVDRLREALAAEGLRVIAILHTHAHIDHMGGTARLARATGAPTYLHAADNLLHRMLPEQAQMLGLGPVETSTISHALTQGDIIRCGPHDLEVVHTPGHSPGSVCFLVREARLCLAGDTLFEDGVGRTDLWGGDTQALVRSIKERLYTLGGDTAVIPGHGGTTTIARERTNNPFVRGE